MKNNLLVVILALIASTGCNMPETPGAPPSVTPVSADTSAGLQPSVEVIGEPEMVYNWNTERCNDNELPDLPTRALRTADGRVQLTIPSTTNYRLIGENFDALENDCAPILVSDYDRNPAHYNHSEWLAATYTLDGQTIYAIVHEEYHGDQAGSVWQAGVDFSSGQGGNQWSYRDRVGSTYQDMQFDAAHNRWQGRRSLCQISAQGMHPDLGCEPTRTWTSPITGTITISGRVYDQDAHGGNGVSAKITKGDQELWSATIENGDSNGQAYQLEVPVLAGDTINFSINALGDSGWDSTFFDPGIDLGSPPCPSKRHDMCTLISLTYAVSTDGGKSYTQLPAPDHRLANFPYRYDPNWMRALWQPSGIVRNPADGYYYALIQFDEHSANYSINFQGMCVMRTQTLDDPASWRAWDGTGFNLRFIDPYMETDADPEKLRCTLVSPEIGALTYGLTYNSYLEKFIAVGVGDRPVTGFYYSLSDDLIHWTPRELLMKASFSFTSKTRFPYDAYPTLIDHESPSPSFDVTGQSPYLYFSIFRGNSPWSIDLMRVKLEFHK